MSKLEIKDLYVDVEGKEILKGINLIIKDHEIHALMGPNGNGKSTLLAAIMGNPKFNITKGEIILDGKNVLEMKVDERSRAGIFLGMQYPSEVAGVSNSDFLRAAINARRDKPIPLFSFIKEMEQTIKDLEMKPDLAHRFLNEGFSGGEKKRNEIVQMKLLKPSIAMLDEIDSGLDVDALKIVAEAIKTMYAKEDMGMLVVSHYERFYQLIQPTHAHVLIDGKIVMSGGYELVDKIDTEGYDWLSKELGIKIKDVERTNPIVLGACAAKNKGK
ncbi:MAG: Fe-S cluster assembly ATPase SufC [Erysipelotrichaceae bacterium]